MTISKKVMAAIERASWIRRMFEAAAKLREERGPDAVADLSLGNPINEPPKAFFDSLREEAAAEGEGRHRYMTNAGYPDVRRSVADHLSERTGIPYEGADICLTVGAAGALNVVLRTILDRGDEVVLVSPAFVEYPFYVENFGGQVCPVPSRPDFLPDIERIADACTGNTKAVIVNSPNNPSGRIYPERVYQDLGRALASRSASLGRPIALIVDDPYYDLYYTPQPPPESVRYYDQVIYITSLSKSSGLAGERIGFIAIHPNCADRDQMRAALPFAMRALGQVNAPAIMQRALVRLLAEPKHELREFYRERRDRVVEALERGGFQTPPLEGAFYAFPRSPEPDDLVFCRRMLDRGLVVVPGTAFGTPGHFRISYAVDMSSLERGLDMLIQG